MSGALFLTGTGTDVGKTFVSGLILKKLREAGLSAGYYKAAMSGNNRHPDGTLIPGDALSVKKTSGIPQPLEEMCPFVYDKALEDLTLVYRIALSPHLAARLEGNPVDQSQVLQGFEQVCRQYDYVTVEGSGGILCPLRFDEQQLWLPDIIRACGLGCLLVADAGLGTINAVGLTAFYLKTQGIPLKGIIFNRAQPGNLLHRDNITMCESLTGVKVLAQVSDGCTSLDMSLELLQSLYE